MVSHSLLSDELLTSTETSLSLRASLNQY